MLLERRARDGILGGSVTVLFRRWRRPQVTAGRTYRTAAGLIDVHEISVVDPNRITDADAAPAGSASADDLRSDLRGEPGDPGDPGDPVYRLRVRPSDGPDPRAELAAFATSPRPTSPNWTAGWPDSTRPARSARTMSVLTAIRDEPGRRAGDLTAAAGREMLSYKADVRRLKALGLTLSLPVGYQLSPRGETYISATSRTLGVPTPGNAAE